MNYRDILEIFQRDWRPVGTRDLIRRMSLGNPRWRAPRIHSELLKLGSEVSQATVGGTYLGAPSPTWRSFPRNHMTDIAAVDMFVVATATFGRLYAAGVVEPGPAVGQRGLPQSLRVLHRSRPA